MIGSYITFLDSEDTEWTINDRVTFPNLWADDPFYFISVQTVDGIYGAEIAYESHPIPNAFGESSGDVFRRGSTITLTGKINALNLAALHTGAEYLKQMFLETNRRKLLFNRLQDGIAVYYIARVNQDLVIVEGVQSGKYELDWVVGLRVDKLVTFKLSDDSVYPEWQET